MDSNFKPIPLMHTVWIVMAGLTTVIFLRYVTFRPIPANYLLVISSLVQFFYAAILLQRAHRQRELLSPLALYSFLLIMHFSIPGLLVALGVMDFASVNNLATAGKAQFFILIGFIFFHCGYVAVSHGISREKQTGIPNSASWSPSCVKFVLTVFLIIGWLDRIHIVTKNAYFQLDRTTIGELSGQFYAAVRLGELLPGIAMIIAWIFFWHSRSRKYKAWWWIGAILWLSELVYWIPTGRKENVILSLLFPMMVRYLHTRKLPSLRTGVITIIFIVALFPAAFYYRSAMERNSTENLTETIQSSAAALNKFQRATGQRWWTILGGRISLLEPVSASIRIVDSGIWPPQLGRTYIWTLSSIIPRVIWTDKPEFHYGTAFGHAADILYADDNQSSVSVTYFGEAYLNFLWLGVLAIFFIGVIFGSIYRYMQKKYFQPTWVFLYTMTLPVILYIGGTFALYFSGLLQQFVIFGTIAYFMSGRPGLPPDNAQDRPA